MISLYEGINSKSKRNCYFYQKKKLIIKYTHLKYLSMSWRDLALFVLQ